jgi:hypothetical protein
MPIETVIREVCREPPAAACCTHQSHSKQVTNGVWTFSRYARSDLVWRLLLMNIPFSPFSRLGFLTIGGRSTAIKLKDGGVWILASTELDNPTKTTIDGMGPVRYIIGADAVHYLYLSAYIFVYHINVCLSWTRNRPIP